MVVSECELSLSLSDKVDMVAIRPCNLFRDIYMSLEKYTLEAFWTLGPLDP